MIDDARRTAEIDERAFATKRALVLAAKAREEFIAACGMKERLPLLGIARLRALETRPHERWNEQAARAAEEQAWFESRGLPLDDILAYAEYVGQRKTPLVDCLLAIDDLANAWRALDEAQARVNRATGRGQHPLHTLQVADYQELRAALVVHMEQILDAIEGDLATRP